MPSEDGVILPNDSFFDRFWKEFQPPPDLTVQSRGVLLEQRPGPGGYDMLGDIELIVPGGNRTRLIVAHRQSIQPKDVASIKQRLRHAIDWRRRAEPMDTELARAVVAVATESASDAVKAACQREWLGLFDLTGTAIVHDGPIFLHVEGTKAMRRRIAIPYFRGAATRVLRVLLDGAVLSGSNWSTDEMAAATELSGPYVWRVMHALEDDGFVHRASPRTGFRMRDAPALLRVWMNSGERPWATMEAYNVRSTERAALLEGQVALRRAGQESAWTLSSATEDAVVFGVAAGLYVSGDATPLVNALKLRKVTPSNFLVLRSPPESATSRGGVFMHATGFVPPAQLILDFHALGGRAREQSEHLFQKWAREIPMTRE